MISKKKCGSCDNFQKAISLTGDGGLCEYYDSRTRSGNSRCKYWKGIKYDRLKYKKMKIEEDLDD